MTQAELMVLELIDRISPVMVPIHIEHPLDRIICDLRDHGMIDCQAGFEWHDVNAVTPEGLKHLEKFG